MANEVSNINFGLAPVAPRPIIKKHLDMFASSLNKIDEKSREALKQRSAIQTALSQIELDSSEDEWKAKYARDIQDQIDNIARGGDYSRALNTATVLAGEAISAPELLGRQKAYRDRQEKWKLVQSRNDIDFNTKKAWDISNKYHYEDKYDANTGRIIGGSKWTADWEPVSEVNDIERITKYISLIAPEQKGVATGNDWKQGNSDGSSAGGGYNKSNQYHKLTKERIHAQLKNALDTDQNWRNSILQRQRVNSILKSDAEAQLEKTTDPILKDSLQAQINNYNEYLTDENGINASPYEVMMKLNKTIINNFAYNNTQSQYTTSSINDAANYNSRGSRSSGNTTSDDGGGQFKPGWVTGAPVAEDVKGAYESENTYKADKNVRNVIGK